MREIFGLVIINGRNDGSIPWHNNPDFYRAMRDGRHGFIAAWNDGTHPKARKKAPADVKKRAAFNGLSRFALNKSYPAFSRRSRDSNPGNGDSTDGDIEGYMNRGLNWTDPREEPKRYEVEIRYDLAAGDLPLTVDVTPRRVQKFRLKQGESCAAVNMDAAGKVPRRLALKADRHGLVTFPAFRVTAKKGCRLVLTR